MVTIHRMRAPGLTWFRLPLFVWAIYATSLIQVLGTPVVAITIVLVAAERIFSFGLFNPAVGGDPVLFQHLFWFYSHPAVYIMILPAMGVISEVIAGMTRKQIFGYPFVAFSSLGIAVVGFLVWGHHLFVAGMSVYATLVFSVLTFIVAIPSAVKVFNWTATMYKGSVSWDTPMLYVAGFIGLFAIGGLTGLFLASVGLDIHVTDTYFVVAHFHYVLFGTVVFAMFGGFYYWWPKLTGRMLNERLGKLHFWLLFIGFHTTFLVQHWLGVEGMPRRIADYLPTDGFTFLNQVSTVGAFLLGISMLPFLWNVWITRKAPLVTSNDPWGWGRSLEWATTCPPPRFNFDKLPRIRSESPAFDLNHPDIAAVTPDNGAQQLVDSVTDRSGEGPVA
jgi:cytochrome c oxidase subunit 1